MSCLRHFEGTKSEKILAMINHKLKEEHKKELPRLKKDKKLLKMRKETLIFKEKLKEQEKRFEEYCEKIGVEWCYYNGGEVRMAKYLTPKKIVAELQKADNLSSLGQRKEAEKIWNFYIKKYKLVE